MADIWTDLEADVAAVIQGDGDAVTWVSTGGPTTVTVFWQAEAVEDEGLGPRFEVASADIPGDADYGDEVTRNDDNYTVQRFLPDGHGLTTVLLREFE
jgi:hypothetical protein